MIAPIIETIKVLERAQALAQLVARVCPGVESFRDEDALSFIKQRADAHNTVAAVFRPPRSEGR